MKIRGWLSVVVTAVSVLAFVGVSGQENPSARKDAPPAINLSETDAVASTKDIATRIWPDRSRVALTAELSELRQGVRAHGNRGGVTVAAWQVVCEDENGDTMGTVTWNAATGELMYIMAGGPRADTEHAMTSSDLRKVVRQWLRDLAGAQSTAGWRELREQRLTSSMTTDWAGNECRARLCVNASSGELIIFRLAPTEPISGQSVARADL